MTRRFETKEVTRDETRCVGITCDVCKVNTASRPNADEWFTQTSYDVSRVTVSCEEGRNYPGCHNTETVSFDLCPTCFHDILTPFLESKGAIPNKSKD